MGLFRKKKTITMLVDDGFLLPEDFYVWMENAQYKTDPESCIWQQLNNLLQVSNFSAALFAQQDLTGIETTNTMVMRADPVHIHADWQGLSVTDSHPQDLSLSDAKAICDDIQQDLAHFGYTLHCPNPYRWYITAHTLEHFNSVPTSCATSDKTHVIQQLPDVLNQLLNQLQINLHHHPINLSREDAGYTTINSLWCWGAATMGNKSITKKEARLYSDNLEVALYAKALDTPHHKISEFVSNPKENQVLILDCHSKDISNLIETLNTASNIQIHYRGTVYYQ